MSKPRLYAPVMVGFLFVVVLGFLMVKDKQYEDGEGWLRDCAIHRPLAECRVDLAELNQ